MEYLCVNLDYGSGGRLFQKGRAESLILDLRRKAERWEEKELENLLRHYGIKDQPDKAAKLLLVYLYDKEKVETMRHILCHNCLQTGHTVQY